MFKLHPFSKILMVWVFVILLYPTQSSANTGLKILVFGDSLSAGYGIPTGADWVSLLKTEMQKRQILVINASISGETIDGGLLRINQTLKRHNPDIVIIELGGNDGLRGYPLNIIQQNLQSLVTLSKAQARVLLLGMRMLPNYGKRYSDAFHDIYRQVAEESQVHRVPFFLDNVITSPDMMQADGIHPNEKAQPQLMQNVLEHLIPMLD